jgi:hypothetical protein
MKMCWKSAFVAAAVLAAAINAAPAAAPEEAAALTVVQASRQPLPDTSAITGELTEKHGVTKFFSLWLVFNDPAEIDVKTGWLLLISHIIQTDTSRVSHFV